MFRCRPGCRSGVARRSRPSPASRSRRRRRRAPRSGRRPSRPAHARPRRRPRAAGRRRPRPVAGRRQAARRPQPVQAAADHADRTAHRIGPAPVAATAATAPVRSAVTERASSSISGVPVSASDRQINPCTVGSPLARVGRKRGDPLQHREPVAAGRHRPEVAERRALQVDLGRHRPLARVMARRSPRGRGRSRLPGDTAASTVSWSRTGKRGHAPHDRSACRRWPAARIWNLPVRRIGTGPASVPSR